ncbi:MAG: hypothetical protein ACLUMK_15050, partial [Christensenellales bacterium]
ALALDVQSMEAFIPDQPEEIPMPDIVIPLHRNLGAALGVAPDMNGPREIVEPRIYVAGKAPVQQAMIDVLEALGHEGAIAVPRELSARMGVVGAAEMGCKLLKDADGGGAYASPLFAYTEEETRGERHAVHALIQCAIRGLLTINGQFCGPVDGGGRRFGGAGRGNLHRIHAAWKAPRRWRWSWSSRGEIVRLEPAARAMFCGRT